MANKINGLDTRTGAIGPAGVSSSGVSGSQPVSRIRDATSGGSASAAGASQDVRITDDARRLASLERVIEQLPDIDAGRVSDISRAIDQGSYRVQPERIAEKLLRQDYELAGSQRRPRDPETR